ncbi:MAG: chorismate--pyruvate lyase family protein, partial [Gammaproteobacteria bacterium]
IPEATLQALPELQSLSNRSLGDLIFKDLQGKRESLEFAQLTPTDKLYIIAAPFHPIANPWARRSLLVAKQHCLLVNEIFIRNYSPCRKEP